MHAGRDPEHVGQKGYLTDSRRPRGFLLSHNGGQAEACYKPVKTKHFKMEGIHMLKDLLRARDWMAKIDLKDASFMIPIALEDRDFRKF